MIVDQIVNNVELGLYHARNLLLMRAVFVKQLIDPILSQELTNGFQSVYFPPTDGTVGVYYGGDNTRKVMYLDGVVNNGQAGSLIGGYSQAFGLQIITGPNTWIRANLPNYLGMMTGNHLQTPEFLDLVGYSAGGAIAQAIAWELRRLGSPLKVQVITYGSPRPGGPSVRDDLSRAKMVRYMTPADPIPLVPPRLQDAPQLAPLVPVPVLLAWSNMVHTHGGMQIESNGSTSEADVPSEAVMTPGTSLASWFLSMDAELGSPHSMQTYVDHLAAANTRFPLPKQKARDIGGGEDADDVNRRDVNQQRDRVVSAVANAQREQNATIVNAPAVVLFRPVRTGRVWAVVFGERIVAQGVREDTCRHICRAGNDFLRSLPKQGLVDPITLAAQMEAFLVYATSEESDWSPKLRTTLNLG